MRCEAGLSEKRRGWESGFRPTAPELRDCSTLVIRRAGCFVAELPCYTGWWFVVGEVWPDGRTPRVTL